MDIRERVTKKGVQAAAAVLVLFLMLFFGLSEWQAKGDQIGALEHSTSELLEQNDDLLAEMRELRKSSRAERRAAVRERNRLVANQSLLLEQQRDLWWATERASKQQKRLLEWLRVSGIPVPSYLMPDVIRVPKKVYVRVPVSGTKKSGSPKKSKSTKKAKRKHSKPKGPGKSRTRGQGKPPRHAGKRGGKR